MIRITAKLSIDDSEIEERFVRASGPGGQNVNKVASAVHLRFDAIASPHLSEAVKTRLRRLAGQRMTDDGVIVILAQRFRTQERNRADARERLVELLAEAARPPTVRRATKPTRASKERRIGAKTQRGTTKQLRKRPDAE